MCRGGGEGVDEKAKWRCVEDLRRLLPLAVARVNGLAHYILANLKSNMVSASNLKMVGSQVLDQIISI